MNFSIQKWRKRFVALFRKRSRNQEMDEELRFHLEMQTKENLAEGMTPEEAHLAALRSFGGVTQVKEVCRERWSVVWLEGFFREMRHSGRSLLREKNFTFTVLAIVALCLAGNVVIFSIVNQALLKPLPFHEPGRLVTIHNNYPKAGILRAGVSVPHYIERKREIAAFASAAGIRYSSILLNAISAPERIDSAAVTPSFFPLLGVEAAVGRTFTANEGLTGQDKVMLLSDAFWHQHFNADPSIVGRTLRIDDTLYTIVGVMPREFHYLSSTAKLWTPLSFSAEDQGMDRRHGAFIEMIARLRPGATLAEAQSQIDALDARVLQTDSFAKMALSVGFHTTVAFLQPDHVSALRPLLLLLQIGVLFLLLIGAVNLANLSVVRATGRTKEFSVRLVLGAGRIRLMSSIVSESLLLSLVGGLLGVGLAAAALRTVTTLLVNLLPIDFAPRLDFTVGFAALGISLIIGLLLALPVVWLTMGSNLQQALAVESRSGTTTRSVHRLRHTLIVAQIALAFVLLSGAGLLGLSLVRVLSVKPGFRRENLLTAQVSLPWGQYKEPAQRVALQGRLIAGLRSMPGLTSVALSKGIPFNYGIWVGAWSIAGATNTADEFIKEGVFGNSVSPDYFATLGIPLRSGRLFTDEDIQLGRKVCLVDEEFAQRHWPQGGALGQRLVLPDDSQHPIPHRDYFTIVGVVGSVKQNDLADQQAHAYMYQPLEDQDFLVSVRTVEAPETAASALRAAVQSVDPALQLVDVKDMASRVDESLADRRTPVLLAGVFAMVSLILAAVGIYGVLAYSVAQRRREIGVRMALGAEPQQILRQFLGLGLKLLTIGVPLGVFGAWICGRAMKGMLFDVAPTNLWVLGSTTLLLAISAMLACFIPSRRASRVSPSEALRSG